MMYFILTFFLGAAVGSFVNVLIDRTVVGEDWVRGRSHCDHCRRVLAWYDMIPLVSYVIYRGQSRCCHTPLSYRYPMVELLTGLLFGWWLVVGFWFFQLTLAPLAVIQPVFWLLTGIIILILTLSDAFYGVVLMPIVYVGIVSVIIYRLALWGFGAYQLADLLKAGLATLGSAGFFAALHWGTKGKGMAEGDIYVAAYVVMVLGYPKGLLALGLSFVLGAVVGLIMIGMSLKKRRDTVPFVPFMMLATIIVLVWGESLISFLG